MLVLQCIQVTVGWGLGGPVSKGVLGIHNPLNVATLDNFAKSGSSKFAFRCSENAIQKKKHGFTITVPGPRVYGITIQSHFGKPSGFK